MAYDGEGGRTKAESTVNVETPPKGLRVLVCGSRHCEGAMSDFVWNWLSGFISERGVSCIIHGAAPGVDTQAMIVADMMPGVKHHPFEADWHRHGRAAGPIRNRRMIEEGKPDLVVAFPGGRGTANMVKQAREAGLEVIHPTPEDAQ